ncbi:MAG: chromate transporter [Tissierellia bacterium]|nr:chromate transporter [Tissierellia bacterium]
MKNISNGELFFKLFKINAITFGGGYTIIPVIKNEFVDKKELIDERDMLDLMAISQSVPGAMAINVSILLGYKIKGLSGAILCMIAASLPCLIIITIISYFYRAFRDNFYVSSALLGMSGIISAILLLTVIDLAKSAMAYQKRFAIIMMILSFILSSIVHVKTGIIIVLCGLSGIIISHIHRRS